MKEVTITPKEIEGCINDLLDAKENYKTAYENVMTANKMLEKKLDEMTQYACDLEDKICYLNGDITNYKAKKQKALSIIEKQKKKMYKSRNKIALFILMKLENILQNGSEKDE